MAQLISVAVKVRCMIKRDDEADVYVSHVPILNLYSQGETEAEAKEAIEEAVLLYLKAAYKFDRMDQLLRRSGFTTVLSGSPPNFSDDTEFIAVQERQSEYAGHVEIEVPLTLLAAQYANECQQLSR